MRYIVKDLNEYKTSGFSFIELFENIGEVTGHISTSLQNFFSYINRPQFTTWLPELFAKYINKEMPRLPVDILQFKGTSHLSSKYNCYITPFLDYSGQVYSQSFDFYKIEIYNGCLKNTNNPLTVDYLFIVLTPTYVESRALMIVVQNSDSSQFSLLRVDLFNYRIGYAIEASVVFSRNLYSVYIMAGGCRKIEPLSKYEVIRNEINDYGELKFNELIVKKMRRN